MKLDCSASKFRMAGHTPTTKAMTIRSPTLGKRRGQRIVYFNAF